MQEPGHQNKLQIKGKHQGSPGTDKGAPTRVEEEKGLYTRYHACAECEYVYIGETGRTLEKRISEHKGAVKTHDEKNGIAVHMDQAAQGRLAGSLSQASGDQLLKEKNNRNPVHSSTTVNLQS